MTNVFVVFFLVSILFFIFFSLFFYIVTSFEELKFNPSIATRRSNGVQRFRRLHTQCYRGVFLSFKGLLFHASVFDFSTLLAAPLSKACIMN